jgi:hypothetical protein
MTWSITFEIKGGGVDAESVKVAGTPPDGVVTVGGHQNGQDKGVSVNMAGASASAYIWSDPPKPELPTSEEITQPAPAADAPPAAES